VRPNSERYLEWIGFHIDEQAPNTYTEVPIELPTSENETLALLLHRIEFEMEHGERIPGLITHVDTGLRHRSGVGYPHINVPDVIASVDLELCIEAAGVHTGRVADTIVPKLFDPPILVATRQIYLFIQGANNVGASECYGRIGYTLEKVSREAFIAALVGF